MSSVSVIPQHPCKVMGYCNIVAYLHDKDESRHIPYFFRCKMDLDLDGFKRKMPFLMGECPSYNLGPVVQSIFSLTSLLRDQLIKCFSSL